MRYAIIFDSTVVNVVVADSPRAPNWVLCPEGFGIGDTYIDGVFQKRVTELRE